MKKAYFLVVLVIFNFLCYAVDLPVPQNTPQSVINAFSSLLQLVDSAGIYHEELDPYTWEDQNYRIKYVDSILSNLNKENLNRYLDSLSKAKVKIDFSEMSKREQEDFENSMKSFYGDRYTFSFSEYYLTKYVSDITKPHKTQYDDLESSRAACLQVIQDQKDQIAKIQNPDEIKTLLDDAIIQKEKARSELQNTKNAKSRKKIEDQITSLENYISNTAVAYNTNLSIIKQLNDAINRNNDVLVNIDRETKKRNEIDRDTEIKNRTKELCGNVNNFYFWVESSTKDTSDIHDFFTVLNIKKNLQEIIENELPQKNIPDYQKKLDDFCKGWNL